MNLKAGFSRIYVDKFQDGGFPGTHPNAKGHQQRADAVMAAIGSNLKARQVKAVEIGTKLQTIKYEMHNLINESLHDSMKIVIPSINCIIKNIVINMDFPKLYPSQFRR